MLENKEVKLGKPYEKNKVINSKISKTGPIYKRILLKRSFKSKSSAFGFRLNTYKSLNLMIDHSVQIIIKC